MHYDVQFLWKGKPHVLRGFKVLRNDPGIDLWNDTTTLYVNVLPEGTDKSLGSGILHIHPSDFAKQLASIRGIAEDSLVARAAAVARFGKFFFGGLWDAYAPALVERSEELMSKAEVDSRLTGGVDTEVRLRSAGAK
jgi:cholesterol oxidase